MVKKSLYHDFSFHKLPFYLMIVYKRGKFSMIWKRMLLWGPVISGNCIPLIWQISEWNGNREHYGCSPVDARSPCEYFYAQVKHGWPWHKSSGYPGPPGLTWLEDEWWSLWLENKDELVHLKSKQFLYSLDSQNFFFPPTGHYMWTHPMTLDKVSLLFKGSHGKRLSWELLPTIVHRS